MKININRTQSSIWRNIMDDKKNKIIKYVNISSMIELTRQNWRYWSVFIVIQLKNLSNVNKWRMCQC